MKDKIFIKIWTIVILLFSVILFTDLSTTNNNYYKASAATSWAKIQLRVNEWSITCTWWYGLLNMWAVNAAFWWQSASGTYAANSWNCIDTKWSQAWALTIRITWDLYGPSTYTISSWNVFTCLTAWPTYMQWTTASPALTTTIPACISTTWLVITQDILRRANTNGQIYQYWTTPRIWVTIPASQSPGTYTWVIEISVP